MDLGLQGKRAIITGAGKGIGKAVAESLAAEGCDLILVSRTAADLEALARTLAERFGIAATPVAVDLADDPARQRLATDYADADILINNAGALPGGELDQVSDET
jgi:3-oxoacyl-[acyl-carrier protein] reductase